MLSESLYNLKAVIHETGLTPSTLRAWERRYKFFKPRRSPGGHRLYTQDEIDILKWLVARQAEGLSISHAVEMLRNLGGIIPAQSSPAIPLTQPSTERTEGTLDNLRSDWRSACLAFNENEAELAMAKALAVASPDVVCIELLQKGMAELGEGWYSGKVTVQQEHFASTLAMRRLNVLFSVAPPPTRPGRLLSVCPPGETHDMALLMVSFLLRWQGWEVLYLGADVPLDYLDVTLQSTEPQLVLSVAQTLPGAAALRKLASFLTDHSIPLTFGGGIFSRIPGLTERISGHFLGHEMTAVPQVVESLLSRPPRIPAPMELPQDYSAALAEFSEKDALIVASIRQALENSAIAPRYVELANNQFSRAIASALVLGDINLLDYSTAWLNGLLKNYGLSSTLATQYYAAYRRSLQQHLNHQSGPILDWFSKVGLPVT